MPTKLNKLKKSLKTMLTNNWILKICSVVLAILIWLAVVNVSDPTKTVVITDIPITVTDEEVLTDQGQVYTVVSDTTATIAVTGKRSVVEDLTKDDFVATASLEEMSQVYAVPVNVSAKSTSVGNNISITQNTWTITVQIENLVTKTYELEIDIKGSAAEGYAVGSYTAGKTEIEVTAPESLHETISTVKAVVDVTDVTESFSDKYSIAVYDSDGNKISNENMTLSSKKVKVQVDVMKVKEVPIEVEGYTGDPASGYMYISTEYTPETVKLIGTEDAIDSVDSIIIPEMAIDITGATDDVEVNVDLAQYLPEDVSIYSQESDVMVTVTIKAIVSKKFTITEDNLTLRNVPDGYVADVVSDTSITLQGIEDAFLDLDVDDLSATVDLSGATEGVNRLLISVTLPDGVTVKSDAYVRVRLTSEEDEEDTTETETSEEDAESDTEETTTE